MEDDIELQLEKILENETGPSSRREWLNALESSKDSPYDYRLDHTRRVVKLAKRISKTMKADTQVVTFAAWLHDIAKPGVTGVPNHGEKSGRLAAEILEKLGVKREIIDRVEDTICKHVGLTLEAQLESIEAQILWEADKLDKLGIVGYVHGIVNSTRMDIEKTINGLAKFLREFFPLANRIADSMFTHIGKEIAQERLKHMMEMSSMLDYEISAHHGEDINE